MVFENRDKKKHGPYWKWGMYTRDTRRNAAFAILEGLSIDSRTIGAWFDRMEDIAKCHEGDCSMHHEVNIYLKKKKSLVWSLFLVRAIQRLVVSMNAPVSGSLNGPPLYRDKERFFLHFHEISVMIIRQRLNTVKCSL